jgi:predicted enzyme related to lactoylglutathione lyase
MPDPRCEYFVARVDGRDVAGIASAPPEAGIAPAWTTHVRVDDVDEAAARTKRAGGHVLAEPFDALPAGRMAVIADPRGAVLSLWEARTREGAQRINEPGAWAMSMLHTDDPKSAARFYGEVFGWGHEPFGGDHALWRLPGYVGGEPQQPVPRDVVAVMTQLDTRAALPPRWTVDFWIDDADAAVERVLRLGGRVVAPRFETPGFRHAVVADTAGATFSISELIRGNPPASA